MGRPQRADHPIRAKAMRCAVGYVGQIIGHDGHSILWECPPRTDGKDDPRGGSHHRPHNSQAMARDCAYDELERGRAEGLYL